MWYIYTVEYYWGICSNMEATRDYPWRRQWHPTPVLLPRKSRGRRSLVGCNPWGRQESDTTEWLRFHFSFIGEGNGNPLRCSCLENPRDGEAWWAAVYGVTQSRTRLKQLSRSSSSRDYPTKQSKSERERQIPYDITYVWNLNMAQANLSTKQKQTHSHRE